MRNFLFRNVSLVDKTGEEGKKKKRKELVWTRRHGVKIRVKRVRNEVFSPPIFQSRRHTEPFIDGGTCTRSYRFPINRSVEQILPRVLFRTLFRRVLRAAPSSIKCRVSRPSPRDRFISSRAYVSPIPDLLPSAFLRISNIWKLIGGEKMADRTSNLGGSLSSNSGEWRSHNASGAVSQDGETS